MSDVFSLDLERRTLIKPDAVLPPDLKIMVSDSHLHLSQIKPEYVLLVARSPQEGDALEKPFFGYLVLASVEETLIPEKDFDDSKTKLYSGMVSPESNSAMLGSRKGHGFFYNYRGECPVFTFFDKDDAITGLFIPREAKQNDLVSQKASVFGGVSGSKELYDILFRKDGF